MGVGAVIIMGDIVNWDDLAMMTGAVLEQLGTVDVLVSKAGIRPRKPFLEMAEFDWELVFDANLKSVFGLRQAFLPGKIDKRWCLIIGFTGLSAIKVYSAPGHHSAVKHAVWGLVKSLDAGFGSKGVTVNGKSMGPPWATAIARRRWIRSRAILNTSPSASSAHPMRSSPWPRCWPRTAVFSSMARQFMSMAARQCTILDQVFFQRSAALLSSSRAATHFAPFSVSSSFQKGALVLSQSIRNSQDRSDASR